MGLLPAPYPSHPEIYGSQLQTHPAPFSRLQANIVVVQMRLGCSTVTLAHACSGNLGPKDVCTPAHQDLVLEAARQGILLLKNDQWGSKHRGGGVAGYVRQAVHAAGCTDIACAGSRQPIATTIDTTRRANATIVVAGRDRKVEAEGLDWLTLLLPGRQAELISTMAKASKSPVVLVLMSGGPINIAFAQNDPRIAAILWVGYPD
ncbi:putative beta-D-xylosidase [Setaria italica]|uniref:putative beta-D-xylosidase n=1 Tax=Setaria italica TaxID=4555 RepID=UPI000350A6B4|nr:putative beta-D-xylosidase [Setaria italica]